VRGAAESRIAGYCSGLGSIGQSLGGHRKLGNVSPTPTLHHVNLKTTRPREMIDWYARVLGMETILNFQGAPG
jgi:hypothetical protein